MCTHMGLSAVEGKALQELNLFPSNVLLMTAVIALQLQA